MSNQFCFLRIKISQADRTWPAWQGSASTRQKHAVPFGNSGSDFGLYEPEIVGVQLGDQYIVERHAGVSIKLQGGVAVIFCRTIVDEFVHVGEDVQQAEIPHIESIVRPGSGLKSIDRVRSITEIEDEQIIARAAVKQVITLLSPQLVIAPRPVQDVVAGASEYLIGGSSAREDIITATTEDGC